MTAFLLALALAAAPAAPVPTGWLASGSGTANGPDGKATGSATFGDVRLEEVADITAYVPLAQVKWAGPGFRYDDGGWIFVHVEGEPYPRGRQYGELVAPELARYLEKLATLQDKADPERGRNGLRRLADALRVSPPL